MEAEQGGGGREKEEEDEVLRVRRDEGEQGEQGEMRKVKEGRSEAGKLEWEETRTLLLCSHRSSKTTQTNR